MTSWWGPWRAIGGGLKPTLCFQCGAATRRRAIVGIGAYTLRLGSWRVAVPAGVGMIAGRELVAHLDHGEHAAHLELSVGALPHHHRQRVLRAAHVSGIGVL